MEDILCRIPNTSPPDEASDYNLLIKSVISSFTLEKRSSPTPAPNFMTAEIQEAY